MIDFIKWCFRDIETSIMTWIFVWLIFEGISHIIESFKSKNK